MDGSSSLTTDKVVWGVNIVHDSGSRGPVITHSTSSNGEPSADYLALGSIPLPVRGTTFLIAITVSRSLLPSRPPPPVGQTTGLYPLDILDSSPYHRCGYPGGQRERGGRLLGSTPPRRRLAHGSNSASIRHGSSCQRRGYQTRPLETLAAGPNPSSWDPRLLTTFFFL